MLNLIQKIMKKSIMFLLVALYVLPMFSQPTKKDYLPQGNKTSLPCPCDTQKVVASKKVVVINKAVVAKKQYHHAKQPTYINTSLLKKPVSFFRKDTIVINNYINVTNNNNTSGSNSNSNSNSNSSSNSTATAPTDVNNTNNNNVNVTTPVTVTVNVAPPVINNNINITVPTYTLTSTTKTGYITITQTNQEVTVRHQNRTPYYIVAGALGLIGTGLEISGIIDFHHANVYISQNAIGVAIKF